MNSNIEHDDLEDDVAIAESLTSDADLDPAATSSIDALIYSIFGAAPAASGPLTEAAAKQLDETVAKATAPRTTWAPVSIDDVLAGSQETRRPVLMPVGDDGVHLLYAGLTHSFYGESESGKSLLAQLEAVRLVNAGERVIYLDFESDAASVVGRLLTFGADREAVRRQFVYVRPDVPHDGDALALDAWDDFTSIPAALVVIDGVTEALSVYSAGSMDNDEVTAWNRKLPQRIAERTGTAVVTIDHVTKSTDSRGRFAIGAQAKLAALTGAAFTVTVGEALAPGRVGSIAVRVAKDRPGGVRQLGGPMRTSDRTQEIATVTVDSTGERPVVSWSPYSEGGLAMPGKFEQPAEPTTQERVSIAVEDFPGITTRGIEEKVHGRSAAVRDALTQLLGSRPHHAGEGRAQRLLPHLREAVPRRRSSPSRGAAVGLREALPSFFLILKISTGRAQCGASRVPSYGAGTHGTRTHWPESSCVQCVPRVQDARDARDDLRSSSPSPTSASRSPPSSAPGDDLWDELEHPATLDTST